MLTALEWLHWSVGFFPQSSRSCNYIYGKWVTLTACTCIQTKILPWAQFNFKSNINLCLLLNYCHWPRYHQVEFTFITLIVELYSSSFEFKCQRYWILTEVLSKVEYIPSCKWFLLLFNNHMINFNLGNTNTCKDAANLVLHVARLKAKHYARTSCTKTKIPPNSRKFYADFALIFWKTGKIARYLQRFHV